MVALRTLDTLCIVQVLMHFPLLMCREYPWAVVAIDAIVNGSMSAEMDAQQFSVLESLRAFVACEWPLGCVCSLMFID